MQDAWFFCTVCATNWLGGYGAFPTSPCPVSKAGGSCEVERLLRSEVQSFVLRDADFCGKLLPSDVMHEVDAAVLNYSGEEVLPMRPLTVDQMEPGLPPVGAGGRVSAYDLVDPGTKLFLADPTLSFLPVEKVEEGPCQAAVHVEAGASSAVARLLVSRGVCKPIRRCDVGRFEGKAILNGLFGVPKPKYLKDGRPILRTIINLIPSNRIQRVIGGHINCLPSITKWQSIILGDGENLLAYQCDMACAFYLFALPDIWLPWFCLNFDLSGRDLGLPSDERYTIACCTLLMGWKSAVGIMQCLSRRVLLESRLPDSHEVRKDRMGPNWLAHCWRQGGEHGWWQVYLDNFISCEVVGPRHTPGDGKRFFEDAHAGWQSFGILCAVDKDVEAAGVAHELGAEIDGELGRLLGGTTRLWKTAVGSIAVALLSKNVTPKRIQVLGGRWAFLAQFRRPLFAVFSDLWRAAVPGCSLAARRRAGVELVMAVMLCPLTSCNLRKALHAEVVATDASERGGAVCVSKGLTWSGKSYSSLLQARSSPLEPNFLVISLFNGIGGAFRAYDLLGIHPLGLVAAECHKPANRVTLRAWPRCLVVDDVNLVDKAMVLSWLMLYPMVNEVHVWGGFPCVHLSSARAGRKNLEGPGSNLFWKLVEIIQIVQEVFAPVASVKWVVENVASMDPDARDEISS